MTKRRYSISCVLQDRSKAHVMFPSTLFFQKAVDLFNEQGMHARTRKQIIDFEVRDHELAIILEIDSVNPLSQPSLSLRALSLYLVETEWGQGAVSETGSLFRCTVEELAGERAVSARDKMLLIKALADLLLVEDPTDNDVQALEMVTSTLERWQLSH